MKAILILIFAVFNFFCTNAQKPKEHTDAKEYGFKGKIKTVTEYRYYSDSIIKKDSMYQLVNKEGYEYKRTYYFNKKGDIDSGVTYFPYKSPVTKEIIPIYNYLVYSFDRAGRKIGFKSFDGKRKLENEGEIKWIDRTHYVQINYGFTNEGKKSKIEEINFTLTNALRELSYEVKTFGIINGAFLSRYIVTNSFDKEGYLQKKRVEYKGEDNDWDEDKYIHQKFDKMKNPLETIQKAGYNNSPKRFILSEYSYY